MKKIIILLIVLMGMSCTGENVSPQYIHEPINVDKLFPLEYQPIFPLESTWIIKDISLNELNLDIEIGDTLKVYPSEVTNNPMFWAFEINDYLNERNAYWQGTGYDPEYPEHLFTWGIPHWSQISTFFKGNDLVVKIFNEDKYTIFLTEMN